MYSSSLHRCLFPPRPKYLPRYPVLAHPQPLFLRQCETPSSTPRQKYGSLHLGLYIFGYTYTYTHTHMYISAVMMFIHIYTIARRTLTSTKHTKIDLKICINARVLDSSFQLIKKESVFACIPLPLLFRVFPAKHEARVTMWDAL